MKKCSFCGAHIDDDSQFCTNCGEKVEPQGKTCPQCGAEIEDDAMFCSKCGMRLDTHTNPPESYPQVVIPETSSQEEEIVYECEEEKDRKWWYVLGGIIAVVLLTFGWYFYSSNHEPQEVDSMELAPEKETSFAELIKKWDEMHNNKKFDDSSSCPYAEKVYFYGTKMSGKKAVQAKQKAVEGTDYQQESTNVKITRISDKLVVCDFEKHTKSNGKTKKHPGCYLYFEDDGKGVWKIKEEGDVTTDKNLLEKASGSYDEITIPITLQFIRNYCDHLKLPYNFWDYVGKEIVEQELNILRYYEPLWGNTYVLRGSIAMNYRYGNENPVYEKLCSANYLEFCDAIGRIRDVWKVLPFRVENNVEENEQPLFQFKYEGNELKDIIITAKYVQDGVEEMDDIPIYHYEYYDDNGKEVKLDLLSD
jgi:predicted nucleic acid-binding Zn ribbon protein